MRCQSSIIRWPPLIMNCKDDELTVAEIQMPITFVLLPYFVTPYVVDPGPPSHICVLLLSSLIIILVFISTALRLLCFSSLPSSISFALPSAVGKIWLVASLFRFLRKVPLRTHILEPKAQEGSFHVLPFLANSPKLHSCTTTTTILTVHDPKYDEHRVHSHDFIYSIRSLGASQTL